MNQKKLQILNAAKELFFQNGFSDTSVVDIIKLANVSKGTFYNHFSSKNECMIAIFQDIHERSVAERKIITHFNNRYDITTLEKELIAHFSIIIESNIMDIMTNNISSKDHEEIFDFIKSRSLYEVDWLGNRLNEIYGPRIKNNAHDFAAMILGSIQQISLIRTIAIPLQFEVDEIVVKVLKNFEPGIYSGRENTLALIPREILIENNSPKKAKDKISLKELVADLEFFNTSYSEMFNKENKEYTHILIDCLKNTNYLNLVVKSVAFSFVNSFKGSPFYNEALVLFQEIEGISNFH